MADKQKSPAFQWYPRDFETDQVVILMDNAQRGIYLRFLNSSWLNEGIPADVESLAVLAGEPLSKFRKMWPRISQKWVPKEGDPSKLVNPRQERERKSQLENIAKASESGRVGAEKRWGRHSNPNRVANRVPNATAMRFDSSASATASASASTPLSPPRPLDDLFEACWNAYPEQGRIKRPLAESYFFDVFLAWDDEQREAEAAALIASISPGGKWAESETWAKGYVSGFGEFVRLMRWKESPKQAAKSGGFDGIEGEL